MLSHMHIAQVSHMPLWRNCILSGRIFLGHPVNALFEASATRPVVVIVTWWKPWCSALLPNFYFI